MLTYTFIGGLSLTVSCFLMIFSKWPWISDTEYNLSGNSNCSSHVGAYIWNLIFLYEFFILFHV